MFEGTAEGTAGVVDESHVVRFRGFGGEVLEIKIIWNFEVGGWWIPFRGMPCEYIATIRVGY